MQVVLFIDSSRYSVIHDVPTQFALTITGITEYMAAFDSGQYQCVVTFNNNGVIRSDLVHLSVYVELQTYTPTSIESGVEVPEGDTVIFTCTSTSTGSPQVVHRWFRGGISDASLVSSTSYTSGDTVTTTYTWMAVNADEDVRYYCQAKNTRWSVKLVKLAHF
uniref:Junctional adhesion molecule A-like n=1 Tax=Saccoglossus kowalevskii TaxID=10224 RepID=A0ABM0MIM8_SACKO|nr:PREDICTED: junctional adhesion molecule A-like [Saccoglossus kowalevskii]